MSIDPVDDLLNELAGTNEDQVGLVSGMVLEHFFKNRPDPSAFPGIAARVIDLLEHPDADVAKLAHLIERDQGISATVLRMANSAAYRRDTQVQTVKAAITMLGLNQVANIAISVACKALFDVEARVEYDLFPARWNRLSHHAMTSAFATGWYAMQSGMGQTETAFLAGMFHDIGKTIGLKSLAALLIDGKLSFQPSDSVIDEAIERVHVEVGSDVHAAWSLPQRLTIACMRHHATEIPDAPEFGELHILRVVSGFNMIRTDAGAYRRVEREVQQSAKVLKIDIEKSTAIAEQVKDLADQVSVLLDIPDTTPNPDYDKQIAALFGDTPAV